MELYCEMGNLLFEKYYRGNLRRARATAGKQLSLSSSQLETTPFKALFPAKFFGIVTRGVLSEIDSVQQKNGFDWLTGSTIPPSYGDNEAGSILSVLDQRIILMNKYSKYNNVTPILKNIRSSQLDKRGLPMAGDDG